jgi:alanine racemase
VTASIQPPESRPEPPERTRAWLEVDLAGLVANARTVASRSGVPLLPMVKANGYGLGAVECARALESVQPWGYGVATWPEAAELRAAGIERPIVVFTPWVKGTGDGGLGTRGVRPVIGDVDSLAAWLRDPPVPRPGSPVPPFHLEIDTGMSRAGIRWNDHAALQRAAELLADAPGWEGVFTHFHSSESDLPATEAQWDRFVDAGDLVRPGIFLYGGAAGERGPAPAPVATLRARVVALRSLGEGEGVSYNETWRAEGPTEIATLALGYADGVLRSGSSRLRVEIGGRVVPVVGRITMDMTMVEVPAGKVRPGDVATIFGGGVSLAEHAATLGTNVYEALTAIGPRIPRVYRRS